MNGRIDIRHVLPVIRVPTLLLHRTGDLDIDVGGARYMAERIPGATYIELPGNDHLVFAGDQEAVLREIEVFLTGALPVPDPERVLATLLLTGIVEGVATAVRLGDQAWGELIAAHDALVREQLTRFHGRAVKRTIGGFLATFDGPARAIRCARAIVDGARDLGLTVRAGLHTGECETIGGELGGVALQIVERVYNRAAPGEVVVSSTITDLVAGSGIAFEELDTRLLTGLTSGWRLHRVMPESQPPRAPFPLPVPVAEERVARSPGTLTPREREIAILIAQGMTNRQVAETLSISPATVERHVANILGKLEFHSRAGVAAWAVAHGLLRPDTG
jgi:DNA-binding CsgD family transcriptional regulator/class 3 adenylate cyclase